MVCCQHFSNITKQYIDTRHGIFPFNPVSSCTLNGISINVRIPSANNIALKLYIILTPTSRIFSNTISKLLLLSTHYKAESYLPAKDFPTTEIKSLKSEPPIAYERACNAIPITISIIPYNIFFCFSNSCVLLNKSKICSSS